MQRGRKAVFGRQPVVQRDHRAMALAAELAAEHVVRGQAADGEAAAVQVQQHGQRRVALRRVKPCRTGMAIAHRHLQWLHPVHFGRGLQVKNGTADVIELAGLRRRQGLHGWTAGAVDALDQQPGRGAQTRMGVGVV